MILTVDGQHKLDPRTSPIESKFGDLKLKYEKIKISIIPSIIILNIK